MRTGATGRVLVAAVAGLALADASIVALALPPILVEMDTTITGVAAIVGVYALVLAAAILPAGAAVRRYGPGRAGAAGFALFAAASLACAAAPALAPLLAFRALQAAGGAVGLLAAFDVLGAGTSAHGRRLWLGAALAGTAAGPALGGALTEAFDWRAIFAVQAPVAIAAAIACARAGVRTPPVARSPAGDDVAAPLWAPPGAFAAPAPPGRTAAPATAVSASAIPLVALGLTAAAFTAVLFLLVLELVAGFAIAPLRAAVGVSVLPVAALTASVLRGPAVTRALAGAALLAGGAAALAFLPLPSLAWAVVPQLLAGGGMGLALPALAGELLPERTADDAARGLLARHAGIVVVLAILAPVASARLAHATDRAVLQGTALVLDARLPPQDKLALAPDLLKGVDAERPRAGLHAAVAARRADFAGERPEYDRLATRLDGVVVTAVQDAFRAAYLIAAALALLAAALLISRVRRPLAVVAAAAVAAAAVTVYAMESHRRAPPAVVLRDPCLPRPLPRTGGITGFLQDQALQALDRGACKYGSTREELALALSDPARAREYKRRYGVDPRSTGGLLSLLGS
jgi:MFS family permease